MYAPLATQARTLNREALVSHLIELTVSFVETRPALPALLDAPHSTRVPAAIRKALRQRFARVLLAQSPRMSARKALLLGSVTLELIKTLNKVYTDLPRQERGRMVQEFKMVLLSYFNARMKPRPARRIQQVTLLTKPAAAVLAIYSLSLLCGCGKSEATTGNPSSAPPPAPEVGVTAVIQKDVPIYGDWVATLDGYVNANIQPQVSGYLIRQNYQEGSPGS